MEITTVSTTRQLLAKRYKVNNYYLLTADGLTPVLSESKEDVFVVRSAVKSIPLKETNEPDKSEKKAEAGTSIKLKDYIGAGSGGGLATGAIQMFQLSNTTSKVELVKFFQNNNCTPPVADTMANTVFECTKSSIGKAIFLGTAGGAVTFSLLELVKPEWSLKKKIMVSLSVFVLLAIIYWVSARFGVMT